MRPVGRSALWLEVVTTQISNLTNRHRLPGISRRNLIWEVPSRGRRDVRHMPCRRNCARSFVRVRSSPRRGRLLLSRTTAVIVVFVAPPSLSPLPPSLPSSAPWAEPSSSLLSSLPPPQPSPVAIVVVVVGAGGGREGGGDVRGPGGAAGAAAAAAAAPRVVEVVFAGPAEPRRQRGHGPAAGEQARD